MGFLSKLNKKHKKYLGRDAVKSGFNKLSGKDASDAARRGAQTLSEAALEGSGIRSAAALKAGEMRAAGGQQGFDFLKGQLDPFASAFGQEDIEGLNALATDSQTQMDYLTDNPLFEALRGQAKDDTFRTQSAGGMLGSSGTDEILQNKFLTMGNDLINQQINRQTPLMQMSQNAATNLGTGGSNLLSQIAGARAGGLESSQYALAGGIEDSAQARATGNIAASNAKAAGMNNLVSAGTSIYSALYSDSRLKENIVKVGNHKGLDTYSWTWNSEANDLGLNGDSFGHIAQEVQAIHPELISHSKGYMQINYGTNKTVNI